MPIARFTGLSSGLDTAALIDAIIEAREQSNKLRKARVETLTGENDAISVFDGKLTALDQIISAFRTVNGAIGKKATSSDPSVLTAAADSSAAAGMYDITVNSLARAGSASFLQSYSSPSALVSAIGSGNVTFDAGTGAEQVSVSVPVTAGVTTVQDLVDAINEAPGAAGRLSAAAINVGTSTSPDYRIFVRSLRTGLSEGELAISADPTILELQLTDLQQAQDASFYLNGLSSTPITRSTNTISDVIPGVTFNLLKEGGATSTIAVFGNVEGAADRVSQMVTAYNELVQYLRENNTVTPAADSQDEAEFGPLARLRADDNFLQSFRSAISFLQPSGKSLSSLGISTNRDGTLTFDRETFVAAANEDTEETGELLENFADRVSGVSGLIYQYSKVGGFLDIAEQGNSRKLDNLNSTIASFERQSEELRRSLEERFARLESLLSRLEQQQQSLQGLFGLGQQAAGSQSGGSLSL